MKREINIAVISDVHLGTYGCHAKELLQYLKSIRPEVLILNGDIIDMWQFKKSYFPKEHTQIISRILKMSSTGTKVYYLPGNHDDNLRKFVGLNIGNIKICDRLELNLNGKKHLFFHGDIFDVAVNYSKFLSKLGGKSYDLLIRFNRFVNKVRNFFDLSNMSFSAKIKAKVKGMSKIIGNFEDSAILLGIEKDMNYVICGHIHQPIIRQENIRNKKIIYMNSGDWVESLTALEYNYGKWEIYHYNPDDFHKPNTKLNVPNENNWDDEDFYTTQQIKEESSLSYFSAYLTRAEASEK
jgi:UDP-2,3-diacylglucosamine pyrophosphatase LpxH